MATVEHNGTSYEVDEDGFLKGSEHWNEGWVEYVKIQSGIKLSDEQETFIDTLQEVFLGKPFLPKPRDFPLCFGRENRDEMILAAKIAGLSSPGIAPC